MNIICVDASRINLFGLQRRTKSIVPRASVYICQNADQAAKLAREKGCDVLLTDIALVMADVSGKGVPAALFMMTSRTMLKDAALTGLDPARVLKRVNARLCENNKDGMFVTVWLAILTISTGELVYADAGHEKLLAYRDGAWGFLPKGKAPALAFAEPEELDEMPERYQFHNETI